MIVMDKSGDLFDERRNKSRRKRTSRRTSEKEILKDRRDSPSDRRSGDERREKDLNE